MSTGVSKYSIVQCPVTSAADPSYQQTDSFNKMRCYGFQGIMICWLNIFTGPGVCSRVPLSSDFCRLGDIPSHGVLISTRERETLTLNTIHPFFIAQLSIRIIQSTLFTAFAPFIVRLWELRLNSNQDPAVSCLSRRQGILNSLSAGKAELSGLFSKLT